MLHTSVSNVSDTLHTTITYLSHIFNAFRIRVGIALETVREHGYIDQVPFLHTDIFHINYKSGSTNANSGHSLNQSRFVNLDWLNIKIVHRYGQLYAF